MSEPVATGVGAQLKRVRESKGISLRQIAAATKISPAALEAIERDDIKRLPGGIFVRSFLRTYAAELGLDPERTVHSFLAQFPDDDDQSPQAVEEPPAFVSALQQFLPVHHSGAFAIGLPILALLIWFVAAGVWSSSDRDQPLLGDRIAALRTDVPPPSALRPVSDAMRAGGALPVQGSGISLTIVAERACWVGATVDGREQVGRLLSSGERVELAARGDLRLRLGDAGAVSLTLNGSPMHSVGASGQVVTLRIDRSTLQALAANR